MVYALTELVDDATTVLEFENDALASWQFKRLCARSSRMRWPSMVTMWLFGTRDDASASIGSDPHEITVDEARAYNVLEWERPFGINGFTSRAPEPAS
jgi:hypothetical protein